jgi:hypothetical protein
VHRQGCPVFIKVANFVCIKTLMEASSSRVRRFLALAFHPHNSFYFAIRALVDCNGSRVRLISTTQYWRPCCFQQGSSGPADLPYLHLHFAGPRTGSEPPEGPLKGRVFGEYWVMTISSRITCFPGAIGDYRTTK